ncbi:MAG: PLP-dependent aminotransferase family protein [Rhizobiaceae bacterium]|nr:PLP-dependent aminotransferase family protein [Rhizobiaceae bacterium]
MSWTPELRKGDGPLYVTICEALERDISEGRLKPSEKLPPHRELAFALGVTVGTVARAYAEAASRGLVIGEIGRGTFVNDFDDHREDVTRLLVSDAKPAELIDLGLNLSAVGEAEKFLRATLKDLARSSAVTAFLSYQPSMGMMTQRAVFAQWLERLGLRKRADGIVICNGGQHGLLMSTMAVAGHGDTIVTDALTYPGIRAIAHQLGIHLAGAAGDQEGMDPDALNELCLSRRPRALYCMPVLQNPTTTTMSERRIREIGAVAERHGLWIIEDDVYGFLARNRPPPFASLFPDRTIYLSSVSKSMAPGLRVGFLAVPPALIATVREVVTMSNWMTAPLMAEVAATWINNGYADHLVSWHRQQAEDRQRIAREILGPHAQLSATTSYHLWMQLPEHWRMDSFSAAALREGVRVITADAFAVKRDHAPHAVRLCLGAAHSLPEIALGLNRLVGLLASRPRPNMDLKSIGYG